MIPLLVATLEGDSEVIECPDVLGRSWFKRVASKAVKSANPVAQIRNVSHATANIGRATGRVGAQLSRGNVKGAFVDLGRAVTTTVTSPVTMAVGAVNKDAGRELEGIIKRNDPNALLNRKIFEAVKKAVRPIVNKFAGELEGEALLLGAESQPTTKKAALRAARGKILAAATAAGTAAGTAVAGPYGAPVGASLVPAAVDAVIDEIGSSASAAIGKAGAKVATSDAIESAASDSASVSSIPKPAIIAAAALAAFFLLKDH
jgi:hypothetical protein